MLLCMGSFLGLSDTAIELVIVDTYASLLSMVVGRIQCGRPR